MNKTSKYQEKWEIRQENEQRTVILAAPITVWEISGKP